MERSRQDRRWASIDRRQFLTVSGGAVAGTLAGSVLGAPRRIAAQGPTPRRGGQVIVGTSQESINYNPLTFVNTGPESATQFLMFDGLWKINDKGELVPNLAIEVPTVNNGGVSKDGLQWVIRLRKGVQWHDGQPFTAKDVKFTWETSMNPKVAVRSRSGHDRVQSFETPDDYTCKIRLKEPFAPYDLVWQMTHIIPEHVLSKAPDINTAPFNTVNPIGTGPFKFVEHVGGDHITVEANKAYHGGAPYVDRVILKLVPDLTVLFTQFKTGEIDAVDIHGILPERYAEAKTLPDRKIYTWGLQECEFIYFNNAKPQLQDKRVRQALYMAMDIDTMLKTIYYGVHVRTLSYLRPDHWAYNPNLKRYPFDPERANRLLDQAGWQRGSDGIRAKDGVRLSFTNSTTAGNKTREQAQAFLQQAWKQIGTEMQIKNMPAAVVWGEYTTQSQFDTLLVAWGNAIASDPDVASRLHSKQIPVEVSSGANYVRYKSTAADRLMEEGVRVTDRNKRREVYWKLQEVLYDELPWAPIYAWNEIMGTKAKLQNYKPNIYVENNLWNASEWWWAV
jgi:peptide/nickel transport system substrate-binding protein